MKYESTKSFKARLAAAEALAAEKREKRIEAKIAKRIAWRKKRPFRK